MAEIFKLAAVTAGEEERAEARALLQRHIDSQELEAVFVVAKTADGMWSWDFAGREFVVEMLGRIDVAKHEYVHKYLDSQKRGE